MRKEEDEDQRVRNLFREITKLLPERSIINTDLLYFKYAPILVMLFLPLENVNQMAAFVSTAIYHEAPVSDYILMGIFLPIADVAFLVFGSLCLKEESENKCLVIKLPDAVYDDKLPKLK